MTSRATKLTFGALVSASLLLSACGEEAKPQASPDLADESRQASSAPMTSEPAAVTPTPLNAEPSQTPPPASSVPDPAGMTAPGTTLKIGETATVKLTESSKRAGAVALTVTAVNKGTEAELKEIDKKGSFSGYTPYYIQIKVAAVDETSTYLHNLSISSSDFRGLLDNGQQAAAALLVIGWDKCKKPSGPRDFTPGTSFEVCIPAFSKGENPVVGVQYKNVHDKRYKDKPIVWK